MNGVSLRSRLGAGVVVAGMLALAGCQTTGQNTANSGSTASSTPVATEQTAKVELPYTKTDVSYVGYDMDFMRDVYQGSWKKTSHTLTGTLYLPKTEGRHPVVVVQHGSGQPDHPNYQPWKDDLRDALLAKGIGSFFADSYSGRGISETTRNQGQLSRASRVVDALMALDALAKRPDVDPAKIGVTGFSFGGTVSNLTANETFVSKVLPGGPRFAAHVPIYPGCGSKFENHVATGAPVLMLVGAADDYTDPAFCDINAEGMRNHGASVEIVKYDNARHGFISDRDVWWYEQAWQFNDCPQQVIGDDGEERAGEYISVGKSWTEFVGSMAKGCGKRGAHIGRNGHAATDGLTRTVEFFTTHLGS